MSAAPTPARPRVAFLSLLESGDWGASEYLWSATAEYLARHGAVVGACILGRKQTPPPVSKLRSIGVEIHERRPGRGHRTRSLAAKLFGRTHDSMQQNSMQFLREFQPDLVLISSPWAISDQLLIWGRNLRQAGLAYAVLVHTHASHVWPDDNIAQRQRHLFSQAQAVYCVSRDNVELLARQLDLPSSFAVVVRNPLAVPRDFAPCWPSNEGPTRLACVGRLDPGQKGQDILLACLQDARWADRRVECNFFGSGFSAGILAKLAASLPAGLANFPGHAPSPATIWESHHALVFPSRFEGLGLVVAEAQLCGRPVIISDCAARELVRDGETGFVAAGTDERALADVLERAWSARSQWARMGTAARAHMLALLPENPEIEFADRLRRVINPRA